jgi:hypothetical protein
MAEMKHTKGPWGVRKHWSDEDKFEVYPKRQVSGPGKPSEIAEVCGHYGDDDNMKREAKANAYLMAAAPELLEVLEEGRRAIGDHYAPSDCYATGPMTGDPIRDLVQCPACSFIGMYESVMAKIAARSPSSPLKGE